MSSMWSLLGFNLPCSSCYLLIIFKIYAITYFSWLWKQWLLIVTNHKTSKFIAKKKKIIHNLMTQRYYSEFLGTYPSRLLNSICVCKCDDVFPPLPSVFQVLGVRMVSGSTTLGREWIRSTLGASSPVSFTCRAWGSLLRQPESLEWRP